MSQILLDFTPELQERVNYWSRRNNKSPEVFMRNIISEYLEDLEDYEEAARISQGIKSGEIKTHSWEEVRQRLGLED